MNFTKEQNQLKEWLKLIAQFYAHFGWLADSFILDFHVESHWNKLPTSWQAFFMSLNPCTLGNWLKLESRSTSASHQSSNVVQVVCPLSLQSFRAVIKTLSFQRRTQTVEEVFDAEQQSTADDAAAELNPVIENIFKINIKEKKRYEIKKLTELIKLLSTKTGTTNVLDIGSGVGHLSRYLSYICSMNVTCIDASQSFISSARKLDDKIEKKLPQIINTKKPNHIQVKLKMNDEINLTKDNNYGFIGLHTCGDLGSLILSTFTNSTNGKFLVSVGCCYMKLSQDGYPLSTFLKDDCSLRFTYEALEVSCHAIEDYCDKLINSNYHQLKIHNYRATLEYLIAQRYPHLKHSGLCHVKDFELKGFKQYCIEATKKLDLNLENEDLDGDTKLNDMANNCWWQVVCFYSLRLLMANVIETAVLLDRLLYLRENDINSTIIPVFDPKLSPRNFVILAIK